MQGAILLCGLAEQPVALPQNVLRLRLRYRVPCHAPQKGSFGDVQGADLRVQVIGEKGQDV